MNDAGLAVVFTVDTLRFALMADSVDFVTRAAALTPLPNAPAIIEGLVNVRGAVIPAVSVRRRSGCPGRPLSPADYFIITRAQRRTLALIADTVPGLLPFQRDDFTPADAILSDAPHVGGVLKSPDGLILIHDLDRFLSLEEELALDEALEVTSS